MRFVFTIIMLLSFVAVRGQHLSYSPRQLRQKCDSILAEAKLLYQYEKLAWTATDLVHEKPNILNETITYFVYQSADSIKAVFINESMESIYELSYLPLADEYLEDATVRPMTEYETEFLDLRNKILDEVLSEKYNVECPEGYSLNVIMLPFKKNYKLYLLTGTAQRGIIPLTNDYLFISDKKANIRSWRKFHKGFLPAEVILPDGSRALELTHSHLQTEPFISATDICTFKLYAPLYHVNSFQVFSPALSKYFVYRLEEDRIEFIDK